MGRGLVLRVLLVELEGISVMMGIRSVRVWMVICCCWVSIRVIVFLGTILGDRIMHMKNEEACDG